MRNLSNFNHLSAALLVALSHAGGGAPPGGAAPDGAPPEEAQAETSLRWPLDPPVRLRSAFGEFREGGRVHGGLDLSTGERTGLPVRAMADGEVFRLKLEWRGYGKAIYQRLADGRILVYAHLESFDLPGLEEAARAARARRGRYPGDIAIDPPLPVRRGEVLARSGESGAGFPHLHFEVRTPENRPANPLGEGVRPPLEDPEPPVFEAVWIHAVEAGSWVGGAAWERRLEARPGRDGAWEAGPARAAGPLDVSVEAHDPASEGAKIGVSRLALRWDGQEVISSRARAFDFAEARRAAAIHDADLSHLSPTRFVYRPLAPRGGPWIDRDPEAKLEGEPGTHHALEIEIEDMAGNRARLEMAVEFVEPRALVRPLDGAAPGERAEEGAPRGTVAWSADPDAAIWLRGAVGLPLAGAASGPRGGEAGSAYRIVGADGARSLAARAWVDAGQDPRSGEGLLVVMLPAGGRLRFEPAGGGPALQAAQRRAGSRALSIGLGSVLLRLPGNAFPRGTPVSLQERGSPAATEGLVEAGPAIRIEPAWRVPAAPAGLRLAYDVRRHQERRLAAFRWDSLGRKWIHAGGAGEARDGSLEVRIGDLGTYRLLEDVAPPAWGERQPAPGARVAASGWSVSVGVEDTGTGIDWDGVEIRLDGKLLESEYDPDRKRVVATPGGALGRGAHRLEARARDRAGNAASPLAWRFTVAPGR